MCSTDPDVYMYIIIPNVLAIATDLANALQIVV